MGEYQTIVNDVVEPRRKGKSKKSKTSSIVEIKRGAKKIQANITPEQQEEISSSLTGQDRAKLSPEERKRQFNLRRLQQTRERRERTVGKIQNAQAEVSANAGSVYQKALNKLNLTTQQEIANTLSSRYTALSSASEFADIYLNNRTKVLIQNEVEGTDKFQDNVKSTVETYIRENKTEKNQKKLLSNLAEFYRSEDKKSSKYKEELNNLEQKRSQLKEQSQYDPKELINIEEKIDQLERGELEETDIARQEKEQEGRISAETKESLKEVSREIRDLKRQRKNILSIQGKVEDKKDQLNKDREILEESFDTTQNTINRLTKLRDKGSKDAILNEIFPDLPQSERTPEKLKAAKQEIRKRLINERSNRKKFQNKIQEIDKQISLDSPELGIRRGAKVTLNPEEQSRIARLLDLKSESEIAKLAEPMSNSDINRLQDRLRRKGDIFRDEEAVNKATRLAVTETSAAYNLGRLFAMSNNKFGANVKYVQVITKNDDKRSVFCGSLDRRIFLLEDVIAQTAFARSFPNTRLEADHPNNKAINPSGIWIFPAHPNCRSYYVPVYTQDQDEELKEDNAVLEEAEAMISAEALPVKGRQAQAMKIAKSIRQERARTRLKIASKIFDKGLRLLTRRFAEEAIVQVTVEDLKKDDSALVATLVSGTAVLSATTLAYFFMKSNLRQALNNYAKEIVSDTYQTGKAILTEMTKAQAVKLAQKIAQEVTNLPASAIEEFIDPLDPTSIPNQAEFELEALAKRGEAGFALAMEGIPVGKTADSLISSGQMAIDGGNSFRNKLYGEILNRTQFEINSLRQQSLNTVGKALGDLGIVDDIDNIAAIELGNFSLEGAKYGRISFKKGPGRFISPQKIEAAIENSDFADDLAGLNTRATQLEKVLKDLDDTIPEDQSPILKKRIQSELARVSKLKNLSKINSKVKSVPLARDLINSFEEVAAQDELAVQKLQDFQVGISRVNDKANLVLSKIKEYLPPKEVLAIEPSSITNLNELQLLKEQIDDSLKLINRDYLKKGEVKKLASLADIRDDVILLRNISADVVSDSVRLEYRPTIEKLDEVISKTVLDEYNLLKAHSEEVEKRIKELT